MDTEQRHSIAGVLNSIKALGWEPATIVDVGVAMGTEGLYSVWPRARIVLIDPVEENQIYMDQIKAKYPHVISLCAAVSNHSGTAVARVNTDLGYAALVPPGKALAITAKNGLADLCKRVLGRDPKPSASDSSPPQSLEFRKVPITTLDAIVETHALKCPMIVKIDTDSHEAEILDGGKECLSRAEICIMEASKLPKKGRITFHEIVDKMHEYGLAFYDFAGRSYGTDPEVRPLRLIDLVFAREEGEVFEKTIARSSKGDKTERRIAQRQAAREDNKYI